MSQRIHRSIDLPLRTGLNRDEPVPIAIISEDHWQRVLFG